MKNLWVGPVSICTATSANFITFLLFQHHFCNSKIRLRLFEYNRLFHVLAQNHYQCKCWRASKKKMGRILNQFFVFFHSILLQWMCNLLKPFKQSYRKFTWHVFFLLFWKKRWKWDEILRKCSPVFQFFYCVRLHWRLLYC